MAKNRVIGKDNKLPWHFPCDLKHFKELTTGHTILMGRKTYESIGKPLPKRESFVVSRTHHENQDHLQYFGSIEEALAVVQTGDCYIIGGETIYRQTLNRIDGVYLTHIDQEFDGDAFYPDLPEHFKEKSRKTLQENPKLEVIYYEKTQ